MCVMLHMGTPYDILIGGSPEKVISKVMHSNYWKKKSFRYSKNK